MRKKMMIEMLDEERGFWREWILTDDGYLWVPLFSTSMVSCHKNMARSWLLSPIGVMLGDSILASGILQTDV